MDTQGTPEPGNPMPDLAKAYTASDFFWMIKAYAPLRCMYTTTRNYI